MEELSKTFIYVARIGLYDICISFYAQILKAFFYQQASYKFISSSSLVSQVIRNSTIIPNSEQKVVQSHCEEAPHI